VISITDSILLVVAGALAGFVGTAGGITSLVSYPALLLVGVPAFAANVANIVALLACWPGSALTSQRELRGRGWWVARWSLVAAAGGMGGAVLLLSTPSGLFVRVVPFLVAGASVTLLAQPRLAKRRQWSQTPGRRTELAAGLVAVSVYNGYFGAGSGVMVLALMLLAVDGHWARANALKNMLVGAATLVSAASFIAFGNVDWRAVAPLAVGLFLGSILGPPFARRLPADVLRWAVALIGFGFAIELFVHHGG